MPFGLVPIFASSKFNLRDPGFRVLGHELPGKTDSLLLLPRVVCSAVVGQLGALCFFCTGFGRKGTSYATDNSSQAGPNEVEAHHRNLL